MSSLRIALIAMVLAAVGAPVAANAADPTGPGTTLPFTSFGGMAVDDANQQVFVTGSSSDPGVAVLDFDGNLLEMIDEPGAGSMVVDRDELFVALTVSGDIRVYDTATREATRTMDLGSHNKPTSLAMAGGRLFYRYGSCGTSSIGIGSVWANDGARTTHPLTGGFPRYCPALATAPGDPNLLMASDTGLSPATLYRMRIDGDDLLLDGQQRLSEQSSARDLAVIPDGSRAILASGAPYSFIERHVADFSVEMDWPAQPYPNAIAYSSDGTYVGGGTNSVYGTDISIFREDGAGLVKSYDFGQAGNASLYPSALEFNGDATRIFAVSQHDYGDRVAFHALAGPRTAASDSLLQLTLRSRSITLGESVSIAGQLSLTDGGSTEDESLRVLHAGPQQPFALATSVVVDRFGRLQLPGMEPTEPGVHRFQLMWPGTATHRGARSHVLDVTVTAPTTLTYTGPTEKEEDEYAFVSAALTDGNGDPIPYPDLRFTLSQEQTVVQTWNVRGSEDGTSGVNLPLTIPAGSYRLDIAFDGIPGFAPASTTTPFTVTRRLLYPQLTYTGPASAHRGTGVRLGATLTDPDDAPLAGRTVSFRIGNELLGSNVTDANGNARLDMLVDQDFGAHSVLVEFAGDDRYVSRTLHALFEVTWQWTFTDDEDRGTVRLNPLTSQLQVDIGAWSSGAVIADAIRPEWLPTVGDSFIVQHEDDSFTIDGVFRVPSRSFAALYQSDATTTQLTSTGG